MALIDPTTALPKGKYIVRYLGDVEFGQCVAANFEISVGEHTGRQVQMLICTKKALQAVNERSGGWIDWMAYDGDTKAGKILDATLNSVGGYFFADLEDGRVVRTSSPIRSESAFNSFLKQICPLWKLHTGDGANQRNMEACKKYWSIMESLPRSWGSVPGERNLRRWLNDATDPNSRAYFHPASVWINAVYVELGGSYEQMDACVWPLLLKNNDFDSPPQRPKRNIYEA